MQFSLRILFYFLWVCAITCSVVCVMCHYYDANHSTHLTGRPMLVFETCGSIYEYWFTQSCFVLLWFALLSTPLVIPRIFKRGERKW